MLAFNSNISLRVIFYFLLAILIGQHILVFCTVNIDYLDDDQIIMWLGAKDYSKGIFHEPRFYGQAYNTFMEALVAVPFIWLKMPVYYAVPLATHLIFLTPFLFTAFYLLKHHYEDKAILIIALLLCMPLGYDVMTSIPRGFITGTFFTLFFVINLLDPKNYKFIFINSFFSIIGYLVNPNSILISLPFLFYVFLNNYQYKKYYVASFAGILSGIPFELLLNQFYRSHPDHIIYTFDNEINVHYFIKAISRLDAHFGHIGLFIEGSCIFTFVVFFIIGIYFFKTNKKWFFTFGLFLTIIFGSLFFQKISHGGSWPFFSLSRMFIAVPVFYLCSIILIQFPLKKWIPLLSLVVLVFTGVKLVTYQSKMDSYGLEKNWVDVNLFSLENTFQLSNSFKGICKEYDTDMIMILGWSWRDNTINYGGPALNDDYPRTFKPHFERRRWRTDEELNRVNTDFIIYSRHNNFDSICHVKYKEVNIQRVNEWGTFYVYNNNKTTLEFLRYIHAETLGF